MCANTTWLKILNLLLIYGYVLGIHAVACMSCGVGSVFHIYMISGIKPRMSDLNSKDLFFFFSLRHAFSLVWSLLFQLGWATPPPTTTKQSVSVFLVLEPNTIMLGLFNVPSGHSIFTLARQIHYRLGYLLSP